MASCPKCKSESRHRLRRKGIYKYIPKTRSYTCDRCNTYYIWFHFIGTSIKSRL